MRVMTVRTSREAAGCVSPGVSPVRHVSMAKAGFCRRHVHPRAQARGPERRQTGESGRRYGTGKEQAAVERVKANTGLQPEKQNQSADDKLEQFCINTIRTLAMDAVQKANSGHPGTPMALAPLAFVLWDRYLRFNPRNPHWPGRDRFILSNGHASMLLYSMLYLTGFDLSARRHQAVSPVGHRRRPAIPSTA